MSEEEKRLFPCVVEGCDYGSSIMSHFRGHMSAQHGNVSDVECPHCSDEYGSVEDLCNHLSANMLVYKACPECAMVSVDAATIRGHMTKAHKKSRGGTPSIDIFVGCGQKAGMGGLGKKFLCCCEFETDELSDFKEHIQTCSPFQMCNPNYIKKTNTSSSGASKPAAASGKSRKVRVKRMI